MKIKVLSALAAIPLALAACQTTSEPPKTLMSEGWFPMNAEQISSVFTSNTLEGDTWTAYFSTATNVTTLYGSGEKLAGVWRANNNQYCRTYPKSKNNSEKCYVVHRRGAEIRFPNGAVGVVKKGNAKSL